MELEKQYNPAHIEEKIYALWRDGGFFSPSPQAGGTPFTIVIPPPNVTGLLHMGHALNNTLQDILIRWKRMQGCNTLWLPGTDHAGIATQNVVERQLAKEKMNRFSLGREAFIKKVWEWKQQYGDSIRIQLQHLGASCDWSRERFTMDEKLSQAVREVFVRLYQRQLIYRGNYIINWCPRCLTALSDEEVIYHESKGSLYYLRYLLKGGPQQHIVVATTRPESMLGDVAIAVNPDDLRYQFLRDTEVILPIMNRKLTVVYDEIVDKEFGTGVVKVTPAHDPNDFLIAQRHNLSSINVMNDNATMNDAAGMYNGMDRFECRKAIMKDLESAGLVEKVEEHTHSVGHCYRCDTVIEPRLSFQWFVKMRPLAEPAIRAAKEGRITFHPGRWTKIYLDWLENIRDWCISRQIWWGHRIPVWTCSSCGKDSVTTDETLAACTHCGSTAVTQETDVLDTWFSSWLWPFSTLGWPEYTQDLKFYYPTSVLVTGQDIIFFWVARMIMAGLEFMGEVPFKNIYIHGIVRDHTGSKMSKSRGNVIDPREIIKEYGADALRFSIIMITAQGQDVFLDKEKFEIGRNFANKLWNASRFLLMNIDPDAVRKSVLNEQACSFDDWYILGSYHTCIQAVDKSLSDYRVNDAAALLYDFVWHTYCDRYIEAVKPVLYGDDAAAKVRVSYI